MLLFKAMSQTMVDFFKEIEILWAETKRSFRCE